MMDLLRSAYDGRRVLLTGHTGFKGSWLALWLQRLGAQTTGLALDPDTSPALFDDARVGTVVTSRIGDIRDAQTLDQAWQACNPEVVFHLAAQPIVRTGYDDPVGTFATNVMGTAHLLDTARRANSSAAIVVVTTDKCYANDERDDPYVETDRLGGSDPYSASKAGAELAAGSWRRSFAMDGETPAHAAVATARAGNVIGGGDWQRDRLLPDCARAQREGTRPAIRNPHAIRPWQHVLECLCGYLQLGAALQSEQRQQFARAFNFGPSLEDSWPVQRVTSLFLSAFGQAPDVRDQAPGPKESHTLRLDSTLAQKQLQWHPRWNVEQAIQRTAAWYQAHATGADARSLCQADLDAYEALLV